MTSLCSAKVILGLTPLQNLFRRIKAKRRDYQRVASLNISVLKTVGSLIHTVCLYENRIVSLFSQVTPTNPDRMKTGKHWFVNITVVGQSFTVWTVWTKQHADNCILFYGGCFIKMISLFAYFHKESDHFPWKKQFYLPVVWFNLNIKAARYSQF